MPRISNIRLLLMGIGLAGAVVAGCSGGGQSGPVSTVQQVSPTTAPTIAPSSQPSDAPTPLPSPAADQGTVVLSLTLPGAGADARRPKYLSPSTRGIALTVYPASTSPPAQTPTYVFDVSPGSARCHTYSDGSRICTGAVNAPAGQDDFIVTAYDQPPQKKSPYGKILSTGSVSNMTVVAGQANTLKVSLGGVIAALSLAPTDTISQVDGRRHVYSLGLNALDADSNYIIGNDPFHNVPTVKVLKGTDPNNTLTVAPANASVNPDPHTYYVTYNGGALNEATIVASAPNVSTTASADFRSLTVTPPSVNATVNVPVTLDASLPGFEGPYFASVDLPNLCEITNQPSGGYFATSPGGQVQVNFTPLGPAPNQCIVFIEADIETPVPSPLPTNLPTGAATITPGEHYASFAVIVKLNKAQ